MATPTLIVFAISHYCEKARWALDYLGVNYAVKHIAPGVHHQLAKKLGAPGSSLPILVLSGQGDQEFIQGSSAIIDWAEANKAADARSLAPQSNRQQALDMEQRLDDVLGVHVRRFYYSEALVDYPQSVRPIFTRDLTLLQRWLVTAAWGGIRKRMIKGMDLGPEQGMQSRELVVTEMEWLDGLLADGRSFLSGDTLSRVDITAASLLAPLVQPEQHPAYSDIQIGPKVAAACKQWEQQTCLQWTRAIYQKNRG